LKAADPGAECQLLPGFVKTEKQLGDLMMNRGRNTYSTWPQHQHQHLLQVSF